MDKRTLDRLAEFTASVEEHGISRRSIEMLERELGSNIITEQININHFTEQNTSIGLEAYRTVYNSILSKTENGYYKIEHYKNTKRLLTDFKYSLDHLATNLDYSDKVIVKVTEIVKPFAGQVFNTDHTGFLSLLDLPLADAVARPEFAKFVQDVTEKTGEQVIRAQNYVDLVKDFTSNKVDSTLPLLDFLSHCSKLVKDNPDMAVNWPVLVIRAYENTIYSLRHFTFRMLLTELERKEEYLGIINMLINRINNTDPVKFDATGIEEACNVIGMQWNSGIQIYGMLSLNDILKE